MAKKFFYVCAGVLMLVLAYQLGASRAIAQAGSSQGFSVGQGVGIGISGRTLYTRWAGGSAEDGPVPVPVPGTSPIVASAAGGWNSFEVILENGDIWGWARGGSSWGYGGNVFGGAVGTEASTWGAVKQRYR
jgi:hypothetical protein